MACISKLANAIAYDCDRGATGLDSAIIINKADIESFVVDNNSMLATSVTLAPGAKAYKIDTVKRSLVLSSALKVNDGAPNAYSHSATVVYTKAPDDTVRNNISAFTNGSFVIIAKGTAVTSPHVYGLYYGMSATAVDNNSHENGGWTTITLETPENVIGEDTLDMPSSVYMEMYKAAVG